MPKNWWFKFDFRVWRTDSALRRCSLETRAFWLEVLCIMHESDSYKLEGSFEELGRLVGCETNEVARCVNELKRTQTADVTLGHSLVTLLSRRMQRELSDREHTRLRQRRCRTKKTVTPMSRDRVISKSKSKKKEEEKEAASPPTHLEEEEVTGLTRFEENGITAYREVYPDTPLSIYLQETICSRVSDLAAWRKALAFWSSNCYRPLSVGKICDYYDEIKRGEHNGLSKRSEREKSAERQSNTLAFIAELRRQGEEEQAVLGGSNGAGSSDIITIESTESH